MNFLEAFDELDTLNEEALTEASPEQQIGGFLSYSFNKGRCPGEGCEKKFPRKRGTSAKAQYIDHVLSCDKVKDTLYKRPALIYTKNADEVADVLDNISAGKLIDYINTNNKCEICGIELERTDLRVDHKHAQEVERKHGYRVGGTFRGMLCNQCNLLLGQIETRASGQNSLTYEKYLAKLSDYIKSDYMTRGVNND